MKYERLPKSNEDDCAGADPAFDPLDDGRLLSLVQRVWSNKHRSTITQAVLRHLKSPNRNGPAKRHCGKEFFLNETVTTRYFNQIFL